MASNQDNLSHAPPASRRSLAGWLLGAVLLLATGAGWMWWHTSSPEVIVTASAPDTTSSAAPSASTADDSAAPLPSPSGASAPSAALTQVKSAASPSTSSTAELQKVQLALDGGTPKQALDAARMLAACEGADQAVGAMFNMRDQPTPETQTLTKVTGAPIEKTIDGLQTLQRQCQAFDAATLARHGELLQKAYDGGAEGAAIDYLLWLSRNGKAADDPALISKLQGAARQAADAGEPDTLRAYAFGFNPSELGISPAQRQGYKEAWLRTLSELPNGSELAAATRASLDKVDQLVGIAPLGAQQQREADALAQKVFDAHLRRGKRG